MRMVSILGDSISTYEGYNPPDYKVFYQGEMLRKNELTSVYDTWWAQVNQFLGAYLCVNNAYSGSSVTGTLPYSASETKRTWALHTQQYSPNIVLVYIGFNDFGQGAPVSKTEEKGGKSRKKKTC